MASIAALSHWLRAGLVAVAAVSCAGAGLARADMVKGTATMSKPGDYARLVIRLDEEVEAEVKVVGSVLVVAFKKPVNVPVARLVEQVPDYVSTARRDPDGTAIRFALTRPVKVNTMAAGERLFVDLLPENWSGMPPGLPQDVVRELAERARAAEKILRQQRYMAEAKKQAPIRVRALMQPTFVRYVFELPDGVGVSTELGRERLTVLFDAPLNFDLADAQVAAPSNVAGLEQKNEGRGTAIELALIGDVNVHSFREDRNFVVDVGFQAEQQVAPRGGISAPPPQPPPAPPVTEPAASSAPKAAPAAAIATALPPPPAVPVQAVELPPPQAPPPSANAPPGASAVEVRRDSDSVRLTFSFHAPVAAALFSRADTLWLIVDSQAPLDLAALRAEAAGVVRDIATLPLADAQAVRMRLDHPQLASLAQAGSDWVLTFADTVRQPPQQLSVQRNIDDPTHANVTIPFNHPARLHRLTDPDSGELLLAVTAPTPSRGFIKRQDFVEFRLLQSMHGVILQPNTDDVSVELAGDRILIGRPGGLTLSAAEAPPEHAPPMARPAFDPELWNDHLKADFNEREHALITAAAMAPEGKRHAGRLDLARFYFAWGFYAEARGVLDTVLAETGPAQDNPAALLLRAAASILGNRPAEGLKDLAHPAISASHDAQIWKAVALARQEKWAEAREKFKNAEFLVSALPVELQRVAVIEALRAMMAVRDYAGANARLNELEVITVPDSLRPTVAVLQGQLAEAFGRDADATANYREAINSPDRRAAAEATLREMLVRKRHGQIKPEEMLADLETLALTWRGNTVEVATMQQLARLYADLGRYREALLAARTTTVLQPNSDIARTMQDAAAAWFSDIYLGTKGDDMPPIEALATFYEFRELTPIGRRGDEMIRRLADRLAAIDLLDQACELLQYQTDHRLEGAARAQVATRLAMFYLMNRKPERAIAALHASRVTELAGELRQQRLLLEARAQSDIGRHDLALDIIANLNGRETVRLRSDIYWAARRWRDAAEQIEVLFGERWREFQPLNAGEKSDIMRAAIGYALAEDALGTARLREKYGPLLAGDDRKAFDIAARPVAATSAEFAAVARMAAAVDTLDGFLREMKVRYPETAARTPLPPEKRTDPISTGSLPVIPGLKSALSGKTP
ncbi:MAG: tetratricopeptide repeat protein [Xanthobacteraceae bacterium]|nr:MAG: tetratricopeptide repeat protein [Xanthobacteraceae bacterium]